MENTVCELCSHKFATKASLARHQRKKKPCSMPIVCDKCKQEFQSQYHLKRHLERITSCVKDPYCHICEKEFKSNVVLVEHRKLCQENQQLKSMLSIQQVAVINNNNNTTNNINIDKMQNIQININITPFGQESTRHLDAATVVKMLENNMEQFLPQMVEYVHANPDAPENRNVIFDPTSNQFFLMNDADKWTEGDPDKTMVKLRNNIQKHIQHMQPQIVPHITKESKNNCENVLMGAKEYRELTPDTINQTKKILENQSKAEEIVKKLTF